MERLTLIVFFYQTCENAEKQHISPLKSAPPLISDGRLRQRSRAASFPRTAWNGAFFEAPGTTTTTSRLTQTTASACKNVPGVCFLFRVERHPYLFSQVELHDRRGDSIPEGWGCDAEGKLNTDPKKVLNGGGLVPIGGSEATGPRPSSDECFCRVKHLLVTQLFPFLN